MPSRSRIGKYGHKHEYTFIYIAAYLLAGALIGAVIYLFGLQIGQVSSGVIYVLVVAMYYTPYPYLLTALGYALFPLSYVVGVTTVALVNIILTALVLASLAAAMVGWAR